MRFKERSMNKLYLLTQTEQRGYDTYDSMVVSAKNEEHAKTMCPSSNYVWENDSWHFQFTSGAHSKTQRTDWTNNINNIAVMYLGETEVRTGIILASFNAG
jgi:hypothetical protein